MQAEEKLDQTSNKNQLETIIAGLTDGIILLGLDGTIRYANTAALHMHGLKRLEELGEDVAAFKTHFKLANLKEHPLPAGQYPHERLLAGESFDDVQVRVQRLGAENDWVHACRGLQVSDAQGQPDFAVLVLQDITREVEAEKRFEDTFEANPAPALIGRLSDLRYVKVNRGFLEMTGFKKEQLIGSTLDEFDVLAKAANHALALERLQAGQTIPQMESCVPTKAGAEKFVILAGQPLELSDEACMLFSFIDLEERKKAEQALGESEERFSKAFRLAPQPASISALEDYRILDVNDAFETVTGHSKTEVVGRTTAGLNMWVERSEREEVEAALQEGRGYRHLDLQLRTKSGDLLDTLASAEVVSINDVPCILSMFQDVTERRRSEADLIAAIEEVMKDASWFSRSVVEKLADLKTTRRSPAVEVDRVELTKRERQVLEFMCRGWKNEQIAKEIGVADITVRNYVTNLYAKLGVHTRSDAILWGRERGLGGLRS